MGRDSGVEEYWSGGGDKVGGRSGGTCVSSTRVSLGGRMSRQRSVGRFGVRVVLRGVS